MTHPPISFSVRHLWTFTEKMSTVQIAHCAAKILEVNKSECSKCFDDFRITETCDRSLCLNSDFKSTVN